jgi:hypothetical protein
MGITKVGLTKIPLYDYGTAAMVPKVTAVTNQSNMPSDAK